MARAPDRLAGTARRSAGGTGRRPLRQGNDGQVVEAMVVDAVEGDAVVADSVIAARSASATVGSSAGSTVRRSTMVWPSWTRAIPGGWNARNAAVRSPSMATPA